MQDGLRPISFESDALNKGESCTLQRIRKRLCDATRLATTRTSGSPERYTVSASSSARKHWETWRPFVGATAARSVSIWLAISVMLLESLRMLSLRR